MKKSIIPHRIKINVAQRADFRCEYCQLPDKISFYTFHIDHIKSIKHGGLSTLDNLAYCCPDCNFNKGSDIGSFIENDQIIRFFNPRIDNWHEHFEIVNGFILSKTDISKVTERIFKFNDSDRIIFRQQLIQLKQYP